MNGFCWELHPNGPFATLTRPAATDGRSGSRPTARVRSGEGEEVWQSDSLNGITLHQLPQIPGGGDFYPMMPWVAT